MKKILFNDEFLLTKAVLDGRKTQTRRIVPQKELDKINLFQKKYYDATFDRLEGVELLTHYFFTEKLGKLPYNVGEMVAVEHSMPHQIRITDMHIERLQDISEEDAIAEGITYAGLFYEDYGEPMFIIEGCKQTFGSARDAYAWIIDKISDKRTWQSNPYVFVYDFELVK